MRLVFLYASRGARNHTNWDPNVITKSSLAIQYTTDGYAYVANKLIDNKVVDEVLAFVETGKYFGYRKIADNHKVYAIPNIHCVEALLKEGDVLFVRGSWKHWANPLNKWCKKHWVFYYSCGTPRNHWPQWHAVLSDFSNKPVMGKRSAHPTFPFTKPINYKVFFPQQLEKKYDILLNSCFHIYDKKGQYRVINAAVEYKKLFGKDLRIAMPGGTYRNTYTSKIPDVIKSNGLNIYQPGVISRENLNNLINQCKLYVHIGYGEMNARSALEAMHCGLPLYIASPHLWPSWLSTNPQITRLCKNPNDPVQMAKDIYQLLLDIENKTLGVHCSKYFDQHNSPEKTVKQFSELLEVMKKYPIPDQNILIRELVG